MPGRGDVVEELTLQRRRHMDGDRDLNQAVPLTPALLPFHMVEHFYTHLSKNNDIYHK